MEGGSVVKPFSAGQVGAQEPFNDGYAAAPATQAANDAANATSLDARLQVSKPADGFYLRVGKRTFDVAFSLMFMLLIGSWLFPLIALAIRIDSAGPVFFRQSRVGLDGKIFRCLKFRTMVHCPDAGFVQAQKNDSRITRVGAMLRRTNLDEIPQFLNVLRGEMSVIGPRPHVPELDHMFQDLVPQYPLRNAVKPGVSGLAQISGCRGETRSIREMNHRVRFDVFYCRNISLTMDLKLIALTVIRALRGDERAY